MKGRSDLLLLVVPVVLCAGLAQTSRGHAVLGDIGLYETPPSYTELAFTNAGSLPNYTKSEKTSVSVSFGIHNVSGRPHAYQWSIVAVQRGTSEVKAVGDVTVLSQGRSTVSKSVALTCAAGHDQVVVRLASPAESIDFWLACPAGTGPGIKRVAGKEGP
jgi:hypothetical protein